MRWVRVAVVALFSAGWLIPLLLAAHFVARWVSTDLAPRIYGLPPTSHGFPYLSTAGLSFWIGCYWLVVVVVFWSVFLAITHFGRRARDA